MGASGRGRDYFMEVLQLKYFHLVAKTENISHAAKAYMVPPSSVSASIKKLEKELGIRLFDRTANRIRLNENGRRFLKAVETAEGAFSDFTESMGAENAEPEGEIRLLILTNRSRVTEAISEFQKSYPRASFSIRHTLSAEKGEDFDVVCADRAPGASYEKYPFIKEELFLAVHRDNPLSQKESITPSEAGEEKFILMPPGTSLRTHTDMLFEKEGILPDCAITCDDPYYICEYVKMGLGVTLFPGASWAWRRDARISLIPFTSPLLRESRIYVHKFAPKVARLFAEGLQKGGKDKKFSFSHENS